MLMTGALQLNSNSSHRASSLLPISQTQTGTELRFD
jgi:hypothetical protein